MDGQQCFLIPLFVLFEERAYSQAESCHPRSVHFLTGTPDILSIIRGALFPDNLEGRASRRGILTRQFQMELPLTPFTLNVGRHRVKP